MKRIDHLQIQKLNIRHLRCRNFGHRLAYRQADHAESTNHLRVSQHLQNIRDPEDHAESVDPLRIPLCVPLRNPRETFLLSYLWKFVQSVANPSCRQAGPAENTNHLRVSQHLQNIRDPEDHAESDDPLRIPLCVLLRIPRETKNNL